MWVPGHEGVAGNEAADQEAKLAAKEAVYGPLEDDPDREEPRIVHTSRRLAPIPLPRSVSALKMAHRAELKVRWQRNWAQAETGRLLCEIDDSGPGPHNRQRHADLGRRASSISRSQRPVSACAQFRCHRALSSAPWVILRADTERGSGMGASRRDERTILSSSRSGSSSSGP